MSDGSRDRGVIPKVSRGELVPNHGLERAPSAVAKANAAFAASIDTVEETGRKVTEAEARVKAAPAEDREASKDALRKGHDPPAPTVGQRRAELAEARRHSTAAKEVALERRDELHVAIGEHLAEWKGKEVAVLRELADNAAPTFEAAAEACRAVDQQAGLVGALHRFAPSRDGRATRFDRSGGTAERTLAGVAAEVREAPQTAASGPSAMEEHSERVAERKERRRKRAEHLEERRKRAGTTKWFEVA
ncbi:MAG: hypothetical protein AABM66_08225 [Actinomycetota bacterium]